MKNVGRIQVASLKKGDGKATSVVVRRRRLRRWRQGEGDGQWKHQERRQVFPLGTAVRGTRGRLDAGVVALGDRQRTKGGKEKDRGDRDA